MNKRDDYIPMKLVKGTRCLLCPICGSERVFPTGLFCFPAGPHKLKVVVEKEGLQILPSNNTSNEETISLAFACESGHRFCYGLFLNRGNTCILRFIPQEDHEFPALPIWGKRPTLNE